MKIVAIVGIRGSGKTTVVEALLQEWQRRGLRAGTVKTVFCPTFHMDKPGTNTDRHTRAGAWAVTVQAEAETAVLYPRPLLPSQILAPYRDCDWVLWEGNYDLPAARIVAACGEQDAMERLNDRTVAVSGLIANDRTEFSGLPALHPQRDIARLADLLAERVADTEDLTGMDAALRGPDGQLSRAFCAQGCRGHAAPKPGVRVTVDGQTLLLSAEQEKQVRAWLAEAANAPRRKDDP
ncbi:MAG: molybdopterin-guanine dinucleotide biosynthesis protein MobB [Clostridia bacterium]|nr:molybdopterin-guanine dinucleotide biosynthesis protein MobB [Clostridia bacterium]